MSDKATTATATATFDLEDWPEDREIAAEHSERAAKVIDRLEAKGMMIMEVWVEGWHFEGKVNLRKEAGIPHNHFLYTRRCIIVAATPGHVGTGDIAVEVETERYGQNGKIRNGRIAAGAPLAIEVGGNWWSEQRKSLIQRGYHQGYRYIRVLTEGPAALAAKAALGCKA